jgi:serine/threonine protein kinase
VSGIRPDKTVIVIGCYVLPMFVCSECGGPQPMDGACPNDNMRLVAIGEDVLLGTTIGAYRVARLLGIGGMGRVYKGVHPTIGSRVAIKVLSRECTDRRDLVERFFAEAKAVNLIRHESIVNVLDLAVLPDGRPYIIMEYLDGAPLASILEHSVQFRQPLPLGGLARLAVEVLDALGAAHGKNIVHRDLKPDNIFVTPSGRPKVLDFGIAKLTDPGLGSSTRTGSLLGTPHYMSPEQAAGRPVDHRADIYAMGVILFECATGQKPFVAESLFDLLRKHVEEPPPSPRSLRADIDANLENLILCALAKTPDQRFATAQAMSMALQHATAHLPPEQWTPITGSGAHRAVPSGGWQPTPPPSWGGGSSPSRALPRPSEQPIGNGQLAVFQPRPPEPIGHQSTVSASSGQVQKQAPEQPSKKGNKGLWLALAGVAVLAGVIAIAVMNRDGGDADTVASADQPQPPPAGEPAAKAKPAGDDDDAKGDIDIDAELDKAMKDLPADVQKQIKDAVGPDAAKQIKALEEQRKRLEKIVKSPAAPTAPAAPAAPVEADDDDDDNANAPAKKAKWIEDRTLTPAGWNPKRVDVAAFIKFAMAEAKKAMPDAQLTRVGVTGVSPDGFANLELPTLASSHGDIELRFISPSHSKPDPQRPAGLPIKLACEFRVQGDPSGVEITAMFETNCKERTVAPPRCTAAALWKLAQNASAPTGNVVANINYYQASMHDQPRYFFDIGFGHDVAFSKVFTAASCP